MGAVSKLRALKPPNPKHPRREHLKSGTANAVSRLPESPRQACATEVATASQLLSFQRAVGPRPMQCCVGDSGAIPRNNPKMLSEAALCGAAYCLSRPSPIFAPSPPPPAPHPSPSCRCGASRFHSEAFQRTRDLQNEKATLCYGLACGSALCEPRKWKFP